MPPPSSSSPKPAPFPEFAGGGVRAGGRRAPEGQGPGDGEGQALVSEVLTRTQKSLPPEAMGIYSPFRGLSPFTESDADQFFGRQRLVNRLIERLRARAPSSRTSGAAAPGTGSVRCLVVVGPCGSGKTSVVRAGLIPQIQALPGGLLVGVRIDHPSLDPFGQLERQGLLRPGEDLIAAALAFARAAGAARLVLFCDHLEELLLLAPQKREQLLSQLLALAGATSGEDGVELSLVLALRSDCAPQLLTAAPALLPLLETATVQLGASLEVAEWTAMVEGPARATGVVIEDGLFAALERDIDELNASLRDGRRAGAALPLLSFALTRLWEGRTGPLAAASRPDTTAPIIFTAADYKSGGGLGLSVGRWADATWGGLGPKLQPAARRVLLELVSGREPSGGGSGPIEASRPLISRPRSLAELRGALRPTATAAPSAASLSRATAAGRGAGQHGLIEGAVEALQGLATSGLLRINVPMDLVELCHPCLLTEWRELGRSYREEQRFQAWLRELAAPAAREGQLTGGGPSLPPAVLTGARLAEAEAWLESRPAQIPESVQRLVTGSLVQRSQTSPHPRAARERSRNGASAHGSAPGRMRGIPTWGLMLGALTPVVLAAGLLVQERARLRDQARLAFDIQSERGARAALLVQHPGQDSAALALGVQAVAPSLRAGQPVPPAAKAGLMTAFSVAKNSLPLFGHHDRVSLASFDPSGLRVLTCSHDHTARIWDARGGQTLVTLSGHRAQLTAAVFSRDGARVLTTSMDHTARIWDARTGQTLITLVGHTDLIETGSLSPDGMRALTAGHDRVAKLWDAASGKLLVTLDGHTDRVTAAAFSPDGKMVLTASWDGTARLWDTATGQLLRVLAGHTNRVNLAMFSPDGTRVVTGGWDHTARIWALAAPPMLGTQAAQAQAPAPAPKDPRAAKDVKEVKAAAVDTLPSVVLQHGTPLHSLAFSSDGRFIATGGTDGLVKLWDGHTGEAHARFEGHTGSVEGIDFAPDGQHLVSAGVDRTVRLWDVRSKSAVAVLHGHSGEIYAATFAPSGAQVVTSSYDRTARVWDVRAGIPLGVLRGHTRGVNSAAFSPDGTRLITTSDDRTARLWRWPGGDTVAVLREHGHAVTCAAFSPDGQLVATGSHDYAVRLWDGHTGQLLRTLHGHTGQVYALAFSPDGRRLVSGGADHTVHVWSATEGTKPLRTAPGHSGDLPWLSFSPDGSLLVSTGTDGSTEIRDGQSARTLRRLESYTATVNTAVFLQAPGALELITGADDGTVRVWDPQTGRQLRTIQAFADGVLSATLSPGGRRLIIATRDQRVRLWDVAAEMPLAVLPAFPEELVAAAYAPGLLSAPEPGQPGQPVQPGQPAAASPTASGDDERRLFLIASVDGTTKIYADDYPANLAGTLTDACARLRYQPEFDQVRSVCTAPQ